MSERRVLPFLLPLKLPAGFDIALDFESVAARIWETAESKVGALVERHPDQFPLYTVNGQCSVSGEAWTNWCEGFLGGELWILARRASIERRAYFRELAEHYT